MREIKYQCWNKLAKCWEPIDSFSMGIFTSSESWAKFNEFHELREYTGLKDSKRTPKYPEGQEIYEGDIVKVTCGCGHQENLPVCQKDGYNGFYLEAKYQHDWDNNQLELNWSERLEVIGNIYENHELLEAK